MRNSLGLECTDVTLVCSDGKRLEAPSKLLSFLSPLLRSIMSNDSSQLILLPDFSTHAVSGVVNLLKKRKEKEEVIKLTRQQIDLLSCLGVHLTNLEEVVDARESGEQARLVCDLCDKKVMNGMEHMLEHSEEVGLLSPSEVDSFFHKERSQEVLENTASNPKSSQIQVLPEVAQTRSRRRGRSLDKSASPAENQGLVVSDQVFFKLERNLSESRPPPAKKQRGGRRMGKHRRVCYVQAGRRALNKMKIKAEENSSILNEDDFQLTLDVAKTLAGRSTPQQEKNTPEVEKVSAIEKSTEIERNMEIETRSTSHMTLRPKLRSVRVQLLKYKMSHNPNKTKRLHKPLRANKNKKPQRPDSENESWQKESATENIESSLRNNILELENIVDDLSFTPEVTIGDMKESSDLEIGEIAQDLDVVPLEIQLGEIDKEIAGLDVNPVVELDHDDEIPPVSCEVESIQEQLMEMNDILISDEEEEDGEIVLLEQQKTDIEILETEQEKKEIEILEEDFSFDNIEEILSVSLDEGSSELSLW